MHKAIAILPWTLALLAGCQQIGTIFQPDSPGDAHYARGQEFLDEGKLTEAMQELARAVEENPRHAPALSAIGDIHRQRGEYEQARAHYESACQADPYAFRPHYNLGVTYQALAKGSKNRRQTLAYHRKAVDAYLRALAIEKENFDASLNIGASYYALGDVALAEQYTRNARELNPFSTEAQNNLGTICRRRGDAREAIRCFRDSLAANPDQPNTVLRLGETCMQAGRYKEALRSLEIAAGAMPTNARCHQKLGVCQFRLRKLDDAAFSFQEAIRLDPTLAPAYRGFGVVCMYQYLRDTTRTDLRDKALRSWNYCLHLQPGQNDLAMLMEKHTPPGGIPAPPQRHLARSQRKSVPPAPQRNPQPAESAAEDVQLASREETNRTPIRRTGFREPPKLVTSFTSDTSKPLTPRAGARSLPPSTRNRTVEAYPARSTHRDLPTPKPYTVPKRLSQCLDT